MNQKLPKLRVRLSEDMRGWLKEAATQNHRAMGAEIIAILDAARSNHDLLAAIFGPPASPEVDATSIVDVKTAIADKAKAIVSGARRSAYGTPEDNFERIARFWQAYFENTGRPDAKITAADVSPLMRLMKEARLCETPGHADSFVDIVGYALTGAEINKVDPADFS